jgi:phosphoribosylamine--glycine ligase
LKTNKLPLVVKADGLAAGKGVTICKTEKEVLRSTEEIFKGKFKNSKKLILEEFLTGEELSYFLIVDKNSFNFFGTAQDHKRVGEKDKGPNTGGMGAYSPAPRVNKKLEDKIIKKIVNPTLQALKRKKKNYTGFLYVGLMIKNGEPYLIEYNVRMGDPECQVIIPRLNTDIIKIFKKVTSNKLNRIKIKWKKSKCMTVVLCSKGYPKKYKKGKVLKNVSDLKLNKSSFIFHAGTKFINKNLVANGGRVLNVTSTGVGFKNIRKNILKILKKINWKYGFFRRDIGWRVIK